jgi:hypothetical protein
MRGLTRLLRFHFLLNFIKIPDLYPMQSDCVAFPSSYALVSCCLQVAVALEKAALADEYFVKRKLYPNVDFYSGLIYR